VGLAVVGGVLFTAGLLTELRCAVGDWPAPWIQRLFSLDGIGGLPRLFITGVFVAVAVLAGLTATRSPRPVAGWWAGVAAGGVVLAVAKSVSTHSAVEQDDGRYVTLAGGVLLSLLGLVVLWRTGRAWSVRAAWPVTVALAAYAAAALGLDELTALVVAVTHSPVARAVATFIEEGGEAVTALVVLEIVSRWVPARSRVGQS
jgi:hypothetical protein